MTDAPTERGGGGALGKLRRIIAKQLDVAYLLEGSVRTSGNRVRITARLIRTADSSHLWSESYDRALTEVSSIQDEIPGAEVRQLRTTLLGGEPSPPGGAHDHPPRTAIDPEAYELHLRGRYEIWTWNRDILPRAEALFERAVERDPSFGDAWASLAETTVLRHEIHQVRDREAAYARATDVARRAVRKGFGRRGRKPFTVFGLPAPNRALRRTENPRVAGSTPALADTSNSMIRTGFRASPTDYREVGRSHANPDVIARRPQAFPGALFRGGNSSGRAQTTTSPRLLRPMRGIAHRSPWTAFQSLAAGGVKDGYSL